MRTLLILAALLVAGAGFGRLTQRESPRERIPAEVRSPSVLLPAKFYLTLSHVSGFHELTVGDERISLSRASDGRWVGSGSIDPGNPVVFFKVSCMPRIPGDGQRTFAKLVVEADGEETFTHVFDADGDIDDFVELPF